MDEFDSAMTIIYTNLMIMMALIFFVWLGPLAGIAWAAGGFVVGCFKMFLLFRKDEE